MLPHQRQIKELQEQVARLKKSGDTEIKLVPIEKDEYVEALEDEIIGLKEEILKLKKNKRPVYIPLFEPEDWEDGPMFNPFDDKPNVED